jgi:hypothetical protein
MFWNADRAMYLPSGFTIPPSRGSSKMSSALIFNHGENRVTLLAGERDFASLLLVEHDPSRYDLLPIDTLKASGQFFKTRFSVGGIGAPLVVVGRSENRQFREQYKLRRIYAPATAIIKFRNSERDWSS